MRYNFIRQFSGHINIKSYYFYLSVILYNLGFFLFPARIPAYFILLGLTVLLLYRARYSFSLSIFLCLVMTLPNEINLFGSITQNTLMMPIQLQLGNGIIITPTTILLIVLLALSVVNSQIKIKLPDIAIFFFLLLSLPALYFFGNVNILYGIITLTELVLLYFLFRRYFRDGILSEVIEIFMFSMFFQSCLGIMQFIHRGNIGLPSEMATISYPYGAVATENNDLFRSTGTFNHPNAFAVFLLTFFPFMLLFRGTSKIRWLLLAIPCIAIILTESRLAFFVLAIVLGIYFYQNNKKRITAFNKKLLSYHTILAGVMICAMVVLMPYIIARLDTVPMAFDQQGSMSMRFKMYQEGWQIIKNYPITGVGLRRSLEVYAANPYTDIFQNKTPTAFYNIHNLFIQIGAEMGLVSTFIFLIFILSVIWISLKRTVKIKNGAVKRIRFASLSGLLLWLVFALLHPLFLSDQMRYFFLLAAILLT